MPLLQLNSGTSAGQWPARAWASDSTPAIETAETTKELSTRSVGCRGPSRRDQAVTSWPWRLQSRPSVLPQAPLPNRVMRNPMRTPHLLDQGTASWAIHSPPGDLAVCA